MHAFGVRSLQHHRVIFQKMMPAGPQQECDDVVDRVLRGNAQRLGFRRRLHDVKRERIAAFRLAARADLQRRSVEQLRSEIEQDTGIAALQFEFDFGQDFLARAGLDRPLVECDFNRRIGQIELPRVPANLRRENRHQRVVRQRSHRIADLVGRKPRQIRGDPVNRRFPLPSRQRLPDIG